MRIKMKLLNAVMLSGVLLVAACGGGSSNSGGGEGTSPIAGQYSGTISINEEDAGNFAPGVTEVLISISPNGNLELFLGGRLLASGPIGSDGEFSIGGPLSDIGGEACTEGSYTLSGSIASDLVTGTLNVSEGVCNQLPVSPTSSPFTARKVEE